MALAGLVWQGCGCGSRGGPGVRGVRDVRSCSYSGAGPRPLFVARPLSKVERAHPGRVLRDESRSCVREPGVLGPRSVLTVATCFGISTHTPGRVRTAFGHRFWPTPAIGAGLGSSGVKAGGRLERDVTAVWGGAVRDVVFECDYAGCSGEVTRAREDRVLAASVDLAERGYGLELGRELKRERERSVWIAGAGSVCVEVEAACEVLGTGRLDRAARGAHRVAAEVERVGVPASIRRAPSIVYAGRPAVWSGHTAALTGAD
jgi:hypothetical protein